MDTGDLKVVQSRLDDVRNRLDEILAHQRTLEASIDRSRGFAVSLNKELELRIRALELEIVSLKTRWSLAVALGAVVVGPVVNWAIAHV